MPNKRVNTVNCVSVCTVYTTCWSECGENNAQRPLSRRLNSATRSRPGRIVFLYVPSVIWSRRHRRHGKITKGILVMGRWRLHDLTRIPSLFPLLFHRDVMIWEIVLRYAISAWVKKRIPSRGIHAWYVRRIYRCRHSDLFIAVRVYLAVCSVSRWLEDLIARVFENVRTLPDEICILYEFVNSKLIVYFVCCLIELDSENLN